MLPKSKPLKFFLIFLLIALVALASWWFFKPKPVQNQYLTAAATMGDIEDTVLATGVIQAQQLVSVGSQVSGQVKKVYVKVGDQVKKGQLIAQIDPTILENTLNTQKASVENLKAQKAQKIAALKQAELEYQRQKDMLAQDATARTTYEQAEATYLANKGAVDALDAQISSAQIAVKTAEVNLNYTKIVAPMDGTIVAQVTLEGQTVNANQTAPTIVKMADLSTLTIQAQISEADVMRVAPGQTVYFTTLGDPDTKRYGTLISVRPAPDSVATSDDTSSSSSSAVYYDALFNVPNSDGKLRIDMTAQVNIVLHEAKNVLTVPSAALTTRIATGNSQHKHPHNKEWAAKRAAENKDQPGKPGLLYVVDAKGNATPRRVRVGLDNRINAEILSGLKEGENVVIADASDTSQDKSKRSSNKTGGGGMGGMRF